MCELAKYITFEIPANLSLCNDDLNELKVLIIKLCAHYSAKDFHINPDQEEFFKKLLEVVLLTLNESASSEIYGYKNDLIRLIANLVYKNKSFQDFVREFKLEIEQNNHEKIYTNGLYLVLSNCNLNENNPYAREWGIFAIRNLCEGNQQNQEVIKNLRVQEAMNSNLLKKSGLKIEISSDGKPVVLPVDKS